jgi:hypothetical protein
MPMLDEQELQVTKNDDFLESHVLGKEHVEEDNNARRLRSEVVLNNRRGFAQCPETRYR